MTAVPARVSRPQRVLTGDELRARLAPRRANKYGAKTSLREDWEYGFVVACDSGAEARFYDWLDYEQIQWRYAPRVVLQDAPLITYRPDALAVIRDNSWSAIDCKGGPLTQMFRLKAKLWASRYPDVPLYVWRNGRLEAA